MDYADFAAAGGAAPAADSFAADLAAAAAGPAALPHLTQEEQEGWEELLGELESGNIDAGGPLPNPADAAEAQAAPAAAAAAAEAGAQEEAPNGDDAPMPAPQGEAMPPAGAALPTALVIHNDLYPLIFDGGIVALRARLDALSVALDHAFVLLWDPVPGAVPCDSMPVSPEHPDILMLPPMLSYPAGPSGTHHFRQTSHNFWCDSHFWIAGMRTTDVDQIGMDPCIVCADMSANIIEAITIAHNAGNLTGTAAELLNAVIRDRFVACARKGASFVHHAYVKARLKYILQRPQSGAATAVVTLPREDADNVHLCMLTNKQASCHARWNCCIAPLFLPPPP